MAKQKGILPIQGTIGNITFFKSADGYLVREKGGVSAKRIASDPAFQRTRENGYEFGRAGSSGKQIRTAFRHVLQHTSDSKMVSRLTRDLMRIIKTDSTSPRGQRTLTEGDLYLLEGFEFNAQSQLSSTLYAPYTATVDRTTDQAAVEIPDFIPASMLAIPEGATHFRISTAMAVIDFEQNQFVNDFKQTAYLALDAAGSGTISHAYTLPAGTGLPVFLSLCIEFFQQVNGVFYVLRNGAYNAMALVKIDQA